LKEVKTETRTIPLSIFSPEYERPSHNDRLDLVSRLVVRALLRVKETDIQTGSDRRKENRNIRVQGQLRTALSRCSRGL